MAVYLSLNLDERSSMLRMTMLGWNGSALFEPMKASLMSVYYWMGRMKNKLVWFGKRRPRLEW